MFLTVLWNRNQNHHFLPEQNLNRTDFRFGAGSGFGFGFNIKWNTEVKEVKNEKTTFWETMQGKILYKFFISKTAKYGLDLVPDKEPQPKLFQSLN
jgi:hypothetical protein